MGERVCRHCLMWKDMPENMLDYLETYINAIPEDDKAANYILEKRILVCKGCNYFQDGLCRACGCYVSLRAAVKKQSCPYKKW